MSIHPPFIVPPMAHVKRHGAWARVKRMYVKSAGSWRPVKKGYVLDPRLLDWRVFFRRGEPFIRPKTVHSTVRQPEGSTFGNFAAAGVGLLPDGRLVTGYNPESQIRTTEPPIDTLSEWALDGDPSSWWVRVLLGSGSDSLLYYAQLGDNTNRWVDFNATLSVPGNWVRMDRSRGWVLIRPFVQDIGNIVRSERRAELTFQFSQDGGSTITYEEGPVVLEAEVTL